MRAFAAAQNRERCLRPLILPMRVLSSMLAEGGRATSGDLWRPILLFEECCSICLMSLRRRQEF